MGTAESNREKILRMKILQIFIFGIAKSQDSQNTARTPDFFTIGPTSVQTTVLTKKPTSNGPPTSCTDPSPYLACEKCYEQKISATIGLHVRNVEEVRIDKEKNNAIRETLANELDAVIGKVCVSEGQFVPVHVKEEEILKIPIHIFGNGEKTKIDKVLQDHAVNNGSEVLIDSNHWPQGAFLMDVEGLNIEELRDELSGSKKHSVGWIIFAFLLIIAVVFGVIYRRRKRFAQYQDGKGRLVVS